MKHSVLTLVSEIQHNRNDRCEDEDDDDDDYSFTQVENVQRGEEQVAHRRVVEEIKPTPPPALPAHTSRPPSLPPSIPAQHSQQSPPVEREVKERMSPPKVNQPRPGETNGMNQMSTLPRLPLPNFSGDMDCDNSPARFVW